MKDLRDIIRAGGYTEGDNTSKSLDDLRIFTSDTGKMSLYPDEASAPKSGASIVMDNNGNINVVVPEKWKDDETVKSIADSSNLKIISGNYKNNKDVEYQDPYDETKKIKTDELVKKMDEALKSQIDVLNAKGPITEDVVERWGGTDAKNKAIRNLKSNNIIVMSMQPDDDDDWVPIPKYMLLAYPQIEKLSTFKKNDNGAFVKVKDFKDNIYNVEDGKITEANAYGIATAPSKVLSKIEDLDPEDIASTIAFGNFISGVDPKRSNWSKFIQAGDALSKGFYTAIFDYGVETSNFLVNLAQFSFITGNSVDTREFWNGAVEAWSSAGISPNKGDTLLYGSDGKFDVSNYLKRSMSYMGATNSEYNSKAVAGYQFGAATGKATDIIVSMIVMGDITSSVKNFVTSKIINKGAENVAIKMAEATDTSTKAGLATEQQARNSWVSGVGKQNAAITSAKNMMSLSGRYKAFFSQTVEKAYSLYNDALAGTTAALNTISPDKLAATVNAAAAVASTTFYANTAIDVLSSMVLSAVVGNKELMTKVLSGKGTSNDVKVLLTDSAFLTLKAYAFLGLTNTLSVGKNWLFEAYPKFGEAVTKMSEAASQKFMKVTSSVAHPWQKFIKWYLDRQTAIARAKKAVLPNRKVTAMEAIREQVLINEARQYGSNLSREKGSNGVKIVNEAFQKAFGESLINGDAAAELTQAEKIDALAKAGVFFTDAELKMSEFAAWKPSYLALQNDLNAWSDIQTNVSQVVKEFSNPNIEPVISQQMSEVQNINTKLLNAEKEAGLLTKIEKNINKRVLKEDGGYIYAYHSDVASLYAVRSYEFKILENEALAWAAENGTKPWEYEPFISAQERLLKAAANTPSDIIDIIDKELLPGLAKLEHNIVNKMVDDKVFPRAFVEGMRAGGKYGKDGESWIRLVARKDLPKGVYNPFSKLVKQDNTIALSSFKVLDDEDITWVGNGLSELITEYGMARAEKKLLEDAKKATGLTTDAIISGAQTGAIRKIDEYKTDLRNATKQGVNSFVEQSLGTVAIGNKRAKLQHDFYEQVSVTGGISAMDISALRVVLQEKGVPSAETITDQASLEKFYDECSEHAKQIIDKTIGARGTSFASDVITPSNMLGNHNFDYLVEDREQIRRSIELKQRQLDDLNAIVETSGNTESVDTAIANLEKEIKDLQDMFNYLSDKLISEKNWPEFWKKASKNVKEIIKKQLKDTSLQTGYGIKGQIIERLNAQVPGFNILDWSLLNREHTNGLVKGGLYSGMDDIEVKAYIFDIDDLADLMGFDLSTTGAEFTNTIGSYQNTLNGEAVLPIDVDNTSKVFTFGGRVNATNDQTTNWAGYLANLKKNGIKKVPVVIKREHPPKSKSMSIDKILGKRGKTSQDITTQLQDAFTSYGKIPFFHGQNSPYGSMEFNNEMAVPQGEDRYDANNGIGDAYWLSPNADYTSPYGNTQLAGNIPTKYFMSDKERVEALDKASKRLSELEDKGVELAKGKIKLKDPEEKILADLNSSNKVTQEALAKAKLIKNKEGKNSFKDLSGNFYKLTGIETIKVNGVNIKKAVFKPTGKRSNINIGVYKQIGPSLLSKKERAEYRLLKKINPDGPGDVSYRALAEYTKKPVIDISIPMQSMPGVRADGTAFFYYKGVSPKFDEEIGKQLLAQKKATSEFVDIPGMSDGAKDIILENRGLSLGNLIESATMGEGLSEEWSNMVSAAEFNGATFTKEKISKEFEEGLADIKKYAPSWGEAIEKVWSVNEPTLDLESIKVNPKDLGAKYTDVLDEDVETYNSTLNPRYNNVGSDIKYKPTKDISYEDFSASLDAGGAAARVELFKAIDEQRFNNLTELKERSPEKYEKLLDQIDRANAANNDDVRNSMQVQSAAEEYRKNITEFELSTVLANKISYLAEAPTPKGSLKEYAENNNIPVTKDGKNIKNDVKAALWVKLINGEEIPEIKGLHIKKIQNEAAAFKDVANGAPAQGPESEEIKSLENMIAEQEAYLKANTPQTDAVETISKLPYKDRKDLVQKIVSSNKGEYVALYRMQNGAPDQWRPNNRGKKGKFEGNAGEYKGYVWLTSDPDWVEGPERASAGVGDDATDDNIVVIPVKKSDITSYNVTGGEADAMRGLESGQKIVQSRGAPKSKNMSIAMAELVDRTNPDAFSKTEFIINAERNPEIFNDGMDLMLQEYNKQFNNRIYRNRADSTKKEIEVLQDELAKLKESSTATSADNEVYDLNQELLKDIQNRFYAALDKTDLFKSPNGPNPYKYEVDMEMLYSDIDDAIDAMMERVGMDAKAKLALQGLSEYYNVELTPARSEFYVLGDLLAEKNAKELDELLDKLAKKITDELIPGNAVIIKGNEKMIKRQIEKALRDKLEARFATAKTYLESIGERADSETVTELLEKYRADLNIAKADPLIVKTTDDNGEIQYERVSPVIADIYNERPVYTPMSTPVKLLSDFALMKKIFTTDLNAKSFSKQSLSDPALAYVTTGALPGTLQALRSELSAQLGDILQYMPTTDPNRYSNIQKIAEREGVSMEEALMMNMVAKASTEIPFALLNNEILRQANVSKYGNKVAYKAQRRTIAQWLNDGLRKVSDKLGTPQNIREKYPRVYAGVKAKLDALQKGYSLAQAEDFETYAINNSTTNFRQKHTVLNGLRPTVPFLTSGISGAKSFWKMFELDPVGVSSRIFTGFIAPIMFFMGEIMSDDELRRKYKNLAENEKENHIIIAVGGELVAIPVGEELGQYVNIVRHVVEKMHDANRFSFYNLMLNDIVGLFPAGDFTGFTDPEMWEPLSGQAPTFLEVMENGTGKMLASTAPPIVQSIFMINSGRDLYTGKKINTSYVKIDADGNANVMSYSNSQFAKALANTVGGDARVIEKVTSGLFGIVTLNVLDAITSAVQYISSGGQEGSLTTMVDKTMADFGKPFAATGYDSLEQRFNSEISALWDRKEEIIKMDEYRAYNEEIAKDKNPESRQKKIAKRNDLFNEFQKKVAAVVEGYRNAGGTLDKWKLSKVTSLITFEDAVRADRTFMHLNTEYSDAYAQAMQTLYDMGITNPDGPSSLGYIYTDKQGNPQVYMWNPVQINIIQKMMKQQGNIHAAQIQAIVNDGTEDSLYSQYKKMVSEEQPYWDKFYSTGKLTDAEWDKIDELRKEFNKKVVLGLTNYMNAYGAANVLSNDEVIQYFRTIIQIPSSYETVRGRYISSGNGKVDKEGAFIESYLKTIFGVSKYGK